MSEAQRDERPSPGIDLESAEDSSGVDLGLPRLEGADRDGVRARLRDGDLLTPAHRRPGGPVPEAWLDTPTHRNTPPQSLDLADELPEGHETTRRNGHRVGDRRRSRLGDERGLQDVGARQIPSTDGVRR